VVTSSALLFPERTWLARLLVWLLPQLVGAATRMEQIIQSSNLDWTLVRTSFLNDRDETAHRRGIGLLPARPGAVSRRAVAGYVMSQVEADGGHRRQVVGLCG